MRVDARTREAGELERFFATFDLPVLAYLRDTQVYVQASAAGMTIFDLPPSRAARDVEQWQAIIEWAEAGDRFAAHEHHEHHEHHKHGEDGESSGT